jgi:Flp pilus assembly protein TadD
MSTSSNRQPVLICHHDRFTDQFAHLLYTHLESYGHTVRFALDPDYRVEGDLTRQLDDCAVMVPVFSPSTVDCGRWSDNCFRVILGSEAAKKCPTLVVKTYQFQFEQHPDYFRGELAHLPALPAVEVRQDHLKQDLAAFREQLAEHLSPPRTDPDNDITAILPPAHLQAEVNIQAAHLAYCESDYETCLRICNAVVDQFPDYLWGYMLRSQANSRLGKPDAALHDIEIGRQLAPNNDTLHGTLGAIYCQMDNFDRAIMQLSYAIDLNPINANNHNLRGWARYRLGDYSGAIRDATRALSLNPEHPGACHTRGISHLCRGELDEAEADLRHLQQLIPNNPFMLGGMALVYEKRGDREKARRFFAPLIEKNAQFADLEWAAARLGWTKTVKDMANPLLASFGVLH